jgi:hypothetical protein
VEAHREVHEDHLRLVRVLDVALHGEEGAAKQASLCDLVEPARKLRGALTTIAGCGDPGSSVIAREALAPDPSRPRHVPEEK